MRLFVTYVALLITASIVAFVVPRNVTEEPHWVVPWDLDFPLSQSAARSNDRSVNEGDQIVTVETERSYVRFATRNGAVFSSGAKADIFDASAIGFVNQPHGAQRWVVQYWDETAPMFVDNLGTPHMADRFLLQIDQSQRLHVDNIVRDEGDHFFVPPGTVFYDICDSCDELRVLFLTIFGDVIVVAGNDAMINLGGTLRDHAPSVVPVLYGGRWVGSDTVVLVYGRRPQRIIVVRYSDERNSGEIIHSIEIPPVQSVRKVVEISLSENGDLVAVPLTGRVLLLDVENGESYSLPYNGTQVHDAVVGAFTVYSGGGIGGVPVTIGNRQRDSWLDWQWIGVEHVTVGRLPFRLVLKKGERIFALGIDQ